MARPGQRDILTAITTLQTDLQQNREDLLGLLRELHEEQYLERVKSIQLIPFDPDLDEDVIRNLDLSESRILLQAIFQNSTLAISMFDREMKYLFANQRWLKDYALTTEVIGKSHYEIFPEISAEWKLLHQRCLAGDAMRREEDRFERANGSIQYIFWEIFPWYRNGDVAGIIMMTKDLTPYYQLEEQSNLAMDQLQVALNSCGVGLSEWDPVTNKVTLNESMMEMIGIPLLTSPLQYEAFFDLVHEEDRARLQKVWKGFVSQQSHPIQVRFTPNGSATSIFNAYTLVRTSKFCQSKQLVTVFQNVTAEIQSKVNMIESETRMRGVFDGMYQFIGLMDPEGILLDANKTALEFGGLTREEVVGKPFWEAHWWQINPETVQQLQEAIQQAANDKEVVRYEVYVQGKNNVVIPIDFSIKPILDQDGQVQYLIPEGRNITETKQLQSKLVRSHQLFEAFMNHSPLFAWMKDENLEYQYLNRSFQSFFNLGEQNYIGKTDEDFGIKALNQTERQALAEKVLHSRMPAQLVETIQDNGGKVHHFLTSKFPVEFVDGSEGLGGVSIDITSLIEMEQELTKVNRQLEQVAKGHYEEAEQAKAELTRFAYTIAHDMRAPLRHISAYIQIIQSELSGQKVEPGTLDLMYNVSSAAAKMSKMIDELLSYARAEKQEVEVSTVHLPELISSLRDMLAAQYPHTTWNIGDLPTLEADEKMLSTIFQNLLENAAKFSSKKEHPTVTITSKDLENGSVEITVEDNGVGFIQEYEAKLFSLFQRLHPQKEFPGTGIGLANVYSLVKNLHGSINGRGKPDEGAIFTIVLPVQFSKSYSSDGNSPS